MSKCIYQTSKGLLVATLCCENMGLWHKNWRYLLFWVGMINQGDFSVDVWRVVLKNAQALEWYNICTSWRCIRDFCANFFFQMVVTPPKILKMMEFWFRWIFLDTRNAPPRITSGFQAVHLPDPNWKMGEFSKTASVQNDIFTTWALEFNKTEIIVELQLQHEACSSAFL